MGISYGIDPVWAAQNNLGRTHMATKGVNQQGLVFNLDLGTTVCYPGSGSILYDLQSNHNLTMYNGIAYSSTDFYGSLVLDGGDDFARTAVGVPLASPTSLTTNFTIEQAFRPTAYAASSYYGLTNMLLQKGTASTYNYATQVTNATTFSFIKRTSPEPLNFHNFTVPSMTGRVNIITLVITSGTTISCYHNGTFISSTAITGSALAAVDADPIYIGSLGGTQYTTFTGSYYGCRIYNRALTGAEVLKNFNATRVRYSI